MEKRRNELLQLQSYVSVVDKELTMMLQSLQWERKHLLEGPNMVQCIYDSNHKIPLHKKDDHEEECRLKYEEYAKDDEFLPELLNVDSKTVVKLSSNDIQCIIDNAARADPTFKKAEGVRSESREPLTLARLQCMYSADERRAIHDAVVAAVPSCHDLTELQLQLPIGEAAAGGACAAGARSRLQVLAELRDMRRRRARYRGPPHARYSHVLRDLIATQMEFFKDTNAVVKTESVDEDYREVAPDSCTSRDQRQYSSDHNPRHKLSDKYRRYDNRTDHRRSDDRIQHRYRHEDKRKVDRSREPSSERNRRDENRKTFNSSFKVKTEPVDEDEQSEPNSSITGSHRQYSDHDTRHKHSDKSRRYDGRADKYRLLEDNKNLNRSARDTSLEKSRGGDERRTKYRVYSDSRDKREDSRSSRHERRDHKNTYERERKRRYEDYRKDERKGSNDKYRKYENDAKKEKNPDWKNARDRYEEY